MALVCGRLLTVGNVGDSLALLDTGASVMALTGDHRVHNSRREQERVRALGGLVTSLLGRVPQRGEIVAHPRGYEFQVLDADPRRIHKLRITLPSTALPDPAK